MLSKWISVLSMTLFLTAAPASVLSQGQTDVLLLKIAMDGVEYVFSDPLKVNQQDGYNNQPSFHPNGNSLFFSSGSGSNTDIYRYDIRTGQTAKLTDTPDSEYSPTVMPGEEKFSVIQLVTSEGPRKGAQPLIAFPLGGGESELIFEEGEKVGYHAWIDREKVALFLLGTPNYLQLVDLKSGSSIRIADNIGRSIYKVPGEEAVSFSQAHSGEPETILIYSLESGETKRIVSMLEGNGFYAWTSSGSLMMGVGTTLFEFRPDQDKNWRKIGDLGSLGITDISRIAVDPQGERLAVVNSR